MYLRTDEELEAAHAMKMAAQFASGIETDPHLWRWVIISLHNSAQGVMVLSLRHGNGLLALKEKSYTDWMAAYEKNETPPQEQLDTYLNLYKKVKHRELGKLGGNKIFMPVGSEGGDIKRLNSLRNEFIHFTPKGWSLEVQGLPRICLSVARLISFLAFETTNVFWHTQAARNQLLESHESFTVNMRKLKLLYDQAVD
ncbi:hypothetical protein CWO84_08435 [Methylomonas sp. Kb3]|uniref:hypothetical protein n=1 Tax=Methylomonas sp. Kb3 TaxID=1611544 RepID=UPI000C34FD8D|nr:hypothetical protein [Methylomonas sp. Kb3]PKD40888.1 hypothetical protein CWO84_08435 [Methylomonas sp. Kb3]